MSELEKLMATLQDARAFAYAKMPLGHGDHQGPPSGVGNDAGYGTTQGLARALTIKKGSSAFVAHVYGFPLDQIEAKEKTLALEILFKL